MFGLMTMLVSTLGATGMGSLLKILGGIFAARAEAKSAEAKRTLVRDLAISKANGELQEKIFGEADQKSAMYSRVTRRIMAIFGMFNYFVISVLCTIFPDVELVTFTPPESKEPLTLLWGLITFPSGADITTSISTGHVTLVAITTLGIVIGFYFTPSANGGK